MDIIQNIEAVIALLGSLVGIIVWFARLEFKVKQNSAEIHDMRDYREILSDMSKNLEVIKNDMEWLKREHERLTE